MVNPYNYTKPNSDIVRAKNLKKPKANNNSREKGRNEAYLVQRVMSAKPQELTLMLYEAMVRFIKLSKYHLEKDDIESTSQNLIKAQNILDELKLSLNKDYEVSNELEVLYDFVYGELLEANISKKLKPIENALEISSELCETWREAMESL